MKEKVRVVVESQETLAGRLFDWLVIFLIFSSLITFSIETLPGLSAGWLRILQISEVTIVALFVVEYLLRVWVAESRPKFIFSFYGIIDLVAILPVFLSLGVDLRSVRAFRLFRILRLLKLARYSSAVDRFSHALKVGREELLLFSGFTLILLLVAAVGIYCKHPLN